MKTSAEVFGHPQDGALGTSTASLLDVGDDSRWQRLLEYHHRLYDAGYVALHWPREYGGGGATLMEQAIYQDEALSFALPLYGANQLAIDRIGPTLMFMGTKDQKERYLHKMLTGEEIWCQGYSEPNAGSRAWPGLQTRAVLDGDSFVVNGQKVWTSVAHRAHMQVLLVRTDPAAPKHKGISYLLVDMKSPGITIRPLVQITGEAGFNEVFYDNVRVPKENLVGEINQGWQVSIATLMYERLSGGTRHPIERTITELLALSRTIQFEGMTANQHSYVRQKLAQFAIEARCLRLSRYRSLSSQLRGRRFQDLKAHSANFSRPNSTCVLRCSRTKYLVHSLPSTKVRLAQSKGAVGYSARSRRADLRSRRAPVKSSTTSSASAS